MSHLSLCRSGRCQPFEIEKHGTPCDILYTPGVDYVYTKYGGVHLNLAGIGSFAKALLSVINNMCSKSITKVWCHILLPPCGNSSVFEPPSSVCEETCSYVRNTCDDGWNLLVLYIKDKTNGLIPINCSNTGEYLDPLPYCCSDVGIDMRMFCSTA